MNRKIIPLSKRPGDIAMLAFFLVNILFITYIADLEQLIIADPAHFAYPLWPPPIAVDAIHLVGTHFRSGIVSPACMVESHNLD